MDTKTPLSTELPPETVDHVVSTWVDVLKTPIPAGGHFSEDDNFFNISTTWTVNDPGKKEAVRFQKNFSILKNSLTWDEGVSLIEKEKLIMSESAASPIDGKLICVSRDGSRKAILVEKNNASGSGKDPKPQFIQIWNRDTLLKSYDLSELDKHKSVYTCGDIGRTMVWSENGEKLAYIAEKKVPKPRPFFGSDVPRDENGNSDDNDTVTKNTKGPRGEEYALKQTWGEQMGDMYFSVVVVLDLKSDKFNIIELPVDQFPTDIQWIDNNSIAGTSYKLENWRLGLIYCNNRESRIFQINVDGSDFRFLSVAGKAAFCPRVSPDNQTVIWQERAIDAPHNRERNIMGIKIHDKKTVPTPTCLYESTAPNLPIYNDFPMQCWARDSTMFFVIEVKDGIQVLMEMIPKDEKVETRFIFETTPGIDKILWIGKNYMLISRSSILSLPYIELVEMSQKNRRVAISITRSSSPDASYSVQKIFGQASIPSFYVGPDGCEPKSVPLIVWLHGGPHACFVDSYFHESTFLVRLGYSFLKVNYIGSTGASKPGEIDELLGKIGTLDVQDCQNIVQKTVQSFIIDPKRVGVWGGSHGGFLTCHLISQFPDFYQVAVARNPVIDLNVMIGTSDITDWCYAETGLPFISSLQTLVPAAKSVEETEKLFRASPISLVSKVKAATLICVGTEDLRVPASQGLAFYRALRAYGKTAEIRVYPDCHPLSSLPVRMDNVIHAALWFKRFMK